MNKNLSSASVDQKSKVSPLGTILAVAFFGPIAGILMQRSGLVLAPPWVSFTGVMYVLVAFSGVLLGGIAALMGWMKGRHLWIALILTGILLIFYLALIASGLPTGMTQCQLVPASPPHVRYACVSTSSDDPGYRYEFTLAGREGFPVMRMVTDK